MADSTNLGTGAASTAASGAPGGIVPTALSADNLQANINNMVDNIGTGASIFFGGGAPTMSGNGVPAYFIPVNDVAPSDPSGMSADQIMNILHNLDTDGVRKAAEAHLNLADKLDGAATRLTQHASTLAGSWKGNAAQAAMDKFQQMHTQTATLAAQARQTGQVLNWTAGMMEKYKSLPTPHGASAAQTDSHIGAEIGGTGGALIGGAIGSIFGGDGGQAKANAQAQKYLHSLNQQLVAANSAMPQTIGQPPQVGMGSVHMSGGGSAGGAGGGVASAPAASPYGGAGAGTAPGAGAMGPAGISKFNGAPLPHGGAGATTKGILASAGPGGGGVSTLPPPGSTAAGVPNGPGGMPNLVPAGPFPKGGSDPVPDEIPADNGPLPATESASADTAGIDGAANGVASEGGAADGVGLGTDGMTGDGMPGMPGMGAGGGAGAASEAAATESVLGTEPLTGTDPAFGAAAAGSEGAAIGDGESNAAAMGAESEGAFPMMGGAGGGEQDRDRQRQVWMNEDTDIWGVPRGSVGSVIGGDR